PGAQLLAVMLERGDRAAGLAWGAQGGGDGLVVGQRLRRGQPAALGGDAPPLRRLGPAHDARRSNVAVGVALAHAQQGLSIVMHLAPPARHPWPSGQKARRVETASLCSRRPSTRRQLAPICRSGAGSNTPIAQWIQYADPRLAPTCRSRTGSYTAVGDRYRPIVRTGSSMPKRPRINSATAWRVHSA